MSNTPPIVMGITGASGAPYAVRLLQALTAARRPVSLIVSKYGLRLLATEAGIESMDALRDAVGIDVRKGTVASTTTVAEAVERYTFWSSGVEAVLTLAGPKGADNVDPWRTVSDSLRWQR